MPGGYLPPFLNPCGQDASDSKCQDYQHKQPDYASVPASVNVTGGAHSVNPITPTGGSPTLVHPLSASGSVGGAPSINFAAYAMGPWPKTWSDASAGDIRYPVNDFEASGAVDLAGLCRQVGRQQAQFRRWVHGSYGFETINGGGQTCAAGPWTTQKYLKFSCKCWMTQACGWTVQGRKNSDGSVIGTDGSYDLGGGCTYEFDVMVDKYSGLLTLSAAAGGDTDTGTFTYSDANTSGIPVTDNFSTGGSHLILGNVKTRRAIAYSCGLWTTWVGTNQSTADLITALNVPLAVVTGPISGIADPSGSGTERFVVTAVTVTHSATSLIIEVTIGPDGDYVFNDGTNTLTQHNTGSATLHIEYALSEPWSFGDVLDEIDAQFGAGKICDFNDRIKHAFRSDGYLTVAPVYSRCERQAWSSPFIFPASTTNGSTNNGFSLANPLAAGDTAWYDVDSYEAIFPYAGATYATALALLYDGTWLDAMRSPGTGAGMVTDALNQANGCFDFEATDHDVHDLCSPGNYGQFTPAFLPPWCQKWTDFFEAQGLWPCGFVAYGTPVTPLNPPLGINYAADAERVTVQFWQEGEIRIPAVNVCRPFGADILVTDYNSPGVTCDGSGNLQRSGSPLGLAYPTCPGLTFDDQTPGVGGRVRAVSITAGVLLLPYAQPNFCVARTETVNCFDASMTLLGTAVATRVDDTRFSGFGGQPATVWITPVFRNDGVTPWVYSDCDDFPKGTWVLESYSFDIDTGVCGGGTAALQCSKYNDICGPTMISANAGAPANGHTVSLSVVRQFDINPNWQQPLSCRDNMDSTFTVIGTTWNPADCSTLPDFVEAYSTTPSGCPPQCGFDPLAVCSPNPYGGHPWDFYNACPAAFPL